MKPFYIRVKQPNIALEPSVPGHASSAAAQRARWTDIDEDEGSCDAAP